MELVFNGFESCKVQGESFPGLWHVQTSYCTLFPLWVFLTKVSHKRFLTRQYQYKNVSYFLFFPSGFLWEISKTHIALTTHSWFFPEKVFHVSYPRGNTNNIPSYFLLFFPLGFYRSFCGISTYTAPHIFPKGFLRELTICHISNIFSSLGFLMGYQWHSDLF